MKNKIVILLCFAWLATACGKKGPLTLEPEKVPLGVENFKIRQVGMSFRLSWDLPEYLSDKKTTLNDSQFGKVFILYSNTNFPADTFRKKSNLFKKINLKEGAGAGRLSFSYSLPLKIKDVKDKKYYFSLYYSYDRKDSPIGPILAIDPLIPPKPVNDLRLAQENKTVILRWTKPTLTIVDAPLKVIKGYRVYRKIEGEMTEKNFREITTSPISLEYFEDSDTSLDGVYSYCISSDLNPQVESDPSNVVSVQIKDAFAPDTPENLVSFVATDHIFLTWKAVADTDLAYYRIFRKTTGEDPFVPIADQIRDNFYKDLKVKKGKTYLYAVSAIDKKGNQSGLSDSVQEKFE